MSNTILRVRNLNTFYGSIHAVKGIDLEIKEGEIVTMVGCNGAGKSTTMLSICGILRKAPGSVIEFMGEDITNLDASAIVKRGICISPEGREVFPGLNVCENLRLGAYNQKDKADIEQSYERVYSLFPRLKERQKQSAGTLSGGEQQMLAIGRAIMGKPKLLLLDEPSLGLAPNLVQLIFKLIADIHNQGVTIMLVEQNAAMALRIADRGYILETGLIKMEDTARNLRNDDAVRRAYLGK